jgi:exonuclease III
VGLGCSIMKPKILVWNVRGLNDKDKSLRIRGLLRDWRADIVCLSETKLEHISREEICYLWGCQCVD